MTSRPSSRVRNALTAVAVVCGLFAAPMAARADTVGDAKKEVERVAAELTALEVKQTQLEDAAGAALDRQAVLQGEIVQAQAQLDEMSTQLGQVQVALQKIALDKFTAGGTSLSPLFSDASAFSAAEQRDALIRLTLDNGATRIDDLQAIVAKYDAAKKTLDRKQAEAAAIVADLKAKGQQYAALQVTLQAKKAAADAKYGQAVVADAQARQDAAAAAAAAAAAQRAKAAQPVVAPRSGGGSAGAGNPGAGSSGGGSSGGSAGGNSGGGSSGGNSGGGNSGGGSSGGGNSGGGVSVPPVSGKAGIAVAAAYSQLGVPYVFAAERPGPGGAFDCSGLTKYAWGQAGVNLPHQSGQQYASLPHVPQSQVQPGDLLFFGSPIHHVVIYVGNGTYIHAPAPGDVVRLGTVRWAEVVGIARPG